MKVMRQSGLVPGPYAKNLFRKNDITRTKASSKRSSVPVKFRRKILFAKRKGYQDKNLEKKGETYANRGF